MTTTAHTTDQIKNLEEKLLNAFQKGDLREIDNFLHNEATFIYPNGLLLTKEMVLDNYRTGKSAFNSIVVSEQLIKVVEGNAVVSMVMELNGKYKDQIISNQYRYIRVWKLSNGEWKVIATSGVLLPTYN